MLKLMMIVMMVNCISINEKRVKINKEFMMMKVKKAIMTMMKGFDDARALYDSDDDDDDSCMDTGDESDDDNLFTDWWNIGR